MTHDFDSDLERLPAVSGEPRTGHSQGHLPHRRLTIDMKRSFWRTYLTGIYRKPSFWLQLIPVGVFGTVVANRSGVWFVVTLYGITLAATIGVIYLFRLRAERNRNST